MKYEIEACKLWVHNHVRRYKYININTVFILQASGIDGKIKLVIEMSEWRYTSGTIYFSIFGMEVISEVEGNKSTNNVPFFGKENEGVDVYLIFLIF